MELAMFWLIGTTVLAFMALADGNRRPWDTPRRFLWLAGIALWVFGGLPVLTG